jgi:Tol biopolymer transport system component
VAALTALASTVVGLTGSPAAHSSLQIAGTTERVSVDSSGGQADGHSRYVAISADGRFVAFGSDAGNLVPGDTNQDGDVFVHDRQTGATERVSVDSLGTQGNGESELPGISADGRFVAFDSGASNLVPGDTNGNADIFVHNRQTGTTERESVDGNGVEANGGSRRVDISSDGRFVVFYSTATNLVPNDTNNALDIFVHDRQTAATERVSVDGSGGQANGRSWDAKLSGDGRFVSFNSDATNLVPADTNGFEDVFVHDRLTGATERVSVDSLGGQLSAGGEKPAISADGRFVVFESGHGGALWLHDRQTGTTERADVDSSGHPPRDQPFLPSISADGRFVAFDSAAGKLVPGDKNHLRDVFVHDRKTGRTTRVSLDSFGAEANGISTASSISADGSSVAFLSVASNLVAGDTNGLQDVFVRQRRPPTIDSFTPTSGITGSKVTINGANLDTTTKLMFNGLAAKFTVLSPTQIRATVPNGATTGKIAVENFDGTDNAAVDYAITFSIVNLSPTTGPVGTVVSLDGIGFTDVTSVKFHRVSAPFSILSPTSIRATVPAGATTGTVMAISPQGTVTGPRFTVTP